MSKTFYEYIEDERLTSVVHDVLQSINSELQEIDDTFYDNVIDPFSAIFDASIQNISYEEWTKQEQQRQVQKTLQNTIGYFHERIIGCINGWENPTAGGYDVENATKKIIAELKNKHNTMNSSTSEAVYTKMAEFLDESKKDYIAYVVTIVPKNSARFNKTFCPSVRGERLPEREDIRVVDGATFYEIATGDEQALKKLYTCLPKVISTILGTDELEETEKTKFNELFTRAFN